MQMDSFLNDSQLHRLRYSAKSDPELSEESASRLFGESGRLRPSTFNWTVSEESHLLQTGRNGRLSSLRPSNAGPYAPEAPNYGTEIRSILLRIEAKKQGLDIDYSTAASQACATGAGKSSGTSAQISQIRELLAQFGKDIKPNLLHVKAVELICQTDLSIGSIRRLIRNELGRDHFKVNELAMLLSPALSNYVESLPCDFISSQQVIDTVIGQSGLQMRAESILRPLSVQPQTEMSPNTRRLLAEVLVNYYASAAYIQ